MTGLEHLASESKRWQTSSNLTSWIIEMDGIIISIVHHTGQPTHIVTHRAQISDRTDRHIANSYYSCKTLIRVHD